MNSFSPDSLSKGSVKTEKLHDRLGSVRQVIDSSGDVENRYTYDPLGELFVAKIDEYRLRVRNTTVLL